MKNLAKKMLNVMSECSHVLKNGENSFHHYKYVTSADVLEKVNESLVKNGLCSIAVPELLNIVDVTNSKGNIERLATVKMDILLIDKDSGETVTIAGIGAGQDPGDKSVMKAQTAAIKYAYMLSLAISTGDDPEADCKTDQNSEGSILQPNQEKRNDIEKFRKAPLQEVKHGDFCESCGSNITEKVWKYSKEKYKKGLCINCQKRYQRIA